MSVTLHIPTPLLAFVPGLALAGAAAVGVPIAIHLLSRTRRRRQPWAAMRFLLEAYRRQKRRLRIEQFLLLAVRCLILALLGLALAGPTLAGGLAAWLGLADPSARLLVLVLDDGLPSAATAQGETGVAAVDPLRLNAQLAVARALVDALGPRDRVALIRAAHPVQSSIPSPTADRAAVMGALEAMRPRYTAADLPAALAAATAIVEDQQVTPDRAFVVVLSDFTRSSLSADRPPVASVRRLGELAQVLITAPGSPAPGSPAPGSVNVQVTAVEPARHVVLLDAAAAAAASVDVTLRRFELDAASGVDEAQTSAQLEAALLAPDGVTPLATTARSVRWPAGQSEVTLRLDLPLTALRRGSDERFVAPLRVSLRDHLDVLPADDARLALLELRRSLYVGLIDEPAAGVASDGGFSPRQWVTLALRPQAEAEHSVDASPIELTDLSTANVDAQALSPLDAAILLRPDRVSEAGWLALRDFVRDGGILWVVAPAVDAASVWGQAMARALDLNWSLGMEPAVAEDSGGDSGDDSGGDSGGGGGWTLATDDAPPPALALLGADWQDLLRPIRVSRRLTLAAALAPEQRWLALAEAGASSTATPAASSSTAALLVAADVGDGKLLLLTVTIDPAWSNLPTKPLFVPLLHESLRGVFGGGVSARLPTLDAGESPALGHEWRDVPRLQWTAPGILRQEGQTATVDRVEPVALRPAAAAGMTTTEPLQRPGLWAAAPQAGGRLLAVNVVAAAGDLTALDQATLEHWWDEIGPWRFLDRNAPAVALTIHATGADLGWPLLWAVLALVLWETLLARRFSHAELDRPAAPSPLARLWGRGGQGGGVR